MIYVIDATSDCSSAPFEPEIYHDLDKVLENLFYYNKMDNHTAYSLSRWESIDQFHADLTE